MKCPKCNQEIADNSKFCEHCGANVSDVQPKAEQVSQPQANPAPQPQVNPTPQPQPAPASAPQATPVATPQKAPMDKKKRNKLIAIVSVVAVLVIGIFIFMTTRKETIELTKFVSVEFSGYDTYGTATVNFDSSKLNEEISEKGKKIEAKDVSELTSLASYAVLLDSIDWSIDKSEGLSNKDKVVVTIKFDNEKAAEFGLKFEGESKEFEVKGLEEIREIDPFEGIDVTFSGISPNVSAQIDKNTTESVLSNVRYELSKSNDIKKGDVVTVTISNGEDDFISDYGCKFTATSKEFTCENVDEYISTVADINEDTLTSMKNQVEDVISAYFANEKEYISQTDLKYEGCYMLYTKTEDNWSEFNVVYVIYSAKVKSEDKENKFDTSTVYFPVKFRDIIKYADGTEYVDLNVNSIEGYSGLKYMYSEVKGYVSKDIMYSELVASKKANYVEDISDTLK